MGGLELRKSDGTYKTSCAGYYVLVPKWAPGICQILNITSSFGERHLVWILIVKSASLKHIVMTWYLTMPADYLLVITGWRTRACKSPNPPPPKKKDFTKVPPSDTPFAQGMTFEPTMIACVMPPGVKAWLEISLTYLKCNFVSIFWNDRVVSFKFKVRPCCLNRQSEWRSMDYRRLFFSTARR